MNTREIANAVGKDERSVRRWVKKAADKMTSIADKMTASSPMKPADYTLDETLSIIEAGMGKNAADIFRTNASLKQPEYVTKSEIIEIIAGVMAQVVPIITSQVISQKQVPAQIQYSPTHFSVLGFCNTHHIKMGMPDMIHMGKECARVSREKGVDIRKCPDERFGEVNAYREDILKEVFSI